MMCGDQMIQMLHQRKLNSCGSMSASRPKSITRKTTRYHLCRAVVPVQNQPGLLPRACHRSWYIKVTRWQGDKGSIIHFCLGPLLPSRCRSNIFLNSMDCIVELTLLVLWTLSVKWMQKKGDNTTSMLDTIQKPQLFKTPQSGEAPNLVLAEKTLHLWSPDLRQFHQGKHTWSSAQLWE